MQKINYTCDICGRPLKTEHDEMYVVTIKISGYQYDVNEGSSNYEDVFHCHCGKCSSKLYKMLEKHKE